MEHFVTLFDRTYLPQGYALYTSMESKIKNFKLWVICIDDETFNFLENQKLPNLQCLKFSELETDELRKVKETRSIVEYYWTITPFTPDFVFMQDDSIKRVTYIDADLWFLKNPQPIFSKFEDSQKSVMITKHGFIKEYDTTNDHGEFCVQFIIFNKNSSAIRESWQSNCLKWCYARNEDGKFGDQKYLDEWPVLYKDQTYILDRIEFTQAPWNTLRFDLHDAIFFHFHGLKILKNNLVSTGNYYLPKETINNIYIPYLKDLKDAIKKVQLFNGALFAFQGKARNVFNKLIFRFYIAFKVKKLKLSQITLKF